jgi:hypothetical protein
MRVTRPEHELLDSLAQSARRITQENEEAVNSLIKKNLAWLSAADDGLIKISPEGFQVWKERKAQWKAEILATQHMGI